MREERGKAEECEGRRGKDMLEEERREREEGERKDGLRRRWGQSRGGRGE